METMDKHGNRVQAGSHFLMGAVTPEILAARKATRINPETSILSTRRNKIDHARRDRKMDLGKAIS